MRQVAHYNLDVIVSVGYRVRFKCGIAFRKWASKVLHDYIVKGYAVNDSRMIKQTVNRFIMDKPAGALLMMDINKFKTMNDSFGHPLYEISVSMGAAFCPEPGRAYAELWKSADEALYRAKKSGLGKVCYRQ